MKRLITFVSLIIIIFLGYALIKNGFENDKFQIASYKTIENKSEALTKKLANYERKNQEEFETAKSNLDSTIKSYKNSKSKYEAIVEELSDVLNNPSDSEQTAPTEEIIYSNQKTYDINYTNVILGNYAKENGVDMTYKLLADANTDTTSSVYKYFLADIEFSVTGQYIDVSNFISDIENDENLAWEISNFSMGSGAGGVTGKFVVKSVPIDSETYIESAPLGEEGENSGDGAVSGDGTTTDNTNTVSNTTNTTRNK